ncbi:MAG: N-acetyltransferase [Spirochaetia bacterium]|nr:N-acetyltransferase [Spirochaetota bacterium]MCX8097265.1 N-acetyltransferase [Spirochaetota bacterium]MDW8111873.1 N-acetyltransferase [Spirochaetia bacterium]
MRSVEDQNISNSITIRDATLDDVDSIYGLMDPYVKTGDLLPRTKDDISDHIRNFIVAQYDGEIVGCMAIKFYSKEMTEFRTLVVSEKFQGRGIGRRLVEKGLEIVRSLGVKRVFVLTRSEEFFKKIGFETVVKEIFPEKVWNDCILCPKLNSCDEIAMIKRLA